LNQVGPELLKGAKLVADSNEFAIYAMGNDAYALVHRHRAVEWQAITISGDGVFRITEMLAQATRSLYRDVAGDLSLRMNGLPLDTTARIEKERKDETLEK
ncbi:MAG: hypothetical protein ACREML_12490, partial [Vulcanimicrobiaceae bacterium]